MSGVSAQDEAGRSVYGTAEERMEYLNRRLAFIADASQQLGGEPVTPADIVKWMAGEPDPRAALDELHKAVRRELGLEAL